MNDREGAAGDTGRAGGCVSCGARVAGVGETGIGGAAGALAVGNEPSLPFVASLFSIVLSYLEGIKEE